MARERTESGPGSSESLTAEERQALARVLPHRYPFLLIDRVLECVGGKRIVALKNVSINEPFFVGHFPTDPVMPGVLICEALAQAGALLAFRSGGPSPANARLLLTGLDETRFRRPVVPGDQLYLEVESVKRRGRTWKMRAVAKVDGVVVAQTQFSAMTVDRLALVEIHPSAIVARGAELDSGVQIGAYSIIGSEVKIGRETEIGPHVVVEGKTTIGERNSISQFASIGSKPQDLKYSGEPSRLEIGNDNQIREFATLNPGTSGGGMLTRVGNGNLLMVHSHVAHDCLVGNQTIMANSSALAGHVVLEDYVIVGGLVAVHQFVRVGESAILGGGAMVNLDVPPFCSAWGDRARLRGLNLIGLKRRGFSPSQVKQLKRAYQLLFLSHRKFTEAVKEVGEERGIPPEVRQMVDFISASKRGVTPAAQADAIGVPEDGI